MTQPSCSSASTKSSNGWDRWIFRTRLVRRGAMRTAFSEVLLVPPHGHGSDMLEEWWKMFFVRLWLKDERLLLVLLVLRKLLDSLALSLLWLSPKARRLARERNELILLRCLSKIARRF